MKPITQRCNGDECDRDTAVAVEDDRACDSTVVEVSPHTPINADSTGLFRAHLIDSGKNRADWKTGIEIELLGFHAGTFSRITPAEIENLLVSFARDTGVTLFENGIPLETTLDDAGRITIEPGGQVEFSDLPRTKAQEIEDDLFSFQSSLSEFAKERGIIFVALGFDPINPITAQQWYPKQRYRVMRPYLASRGKRAWDMMARTCAVQVNIDYESETDLAAKFLVGNRLAPIVTAMFANSPFEGGRPSGFKSTRAAAWLETDDDRSGISPAALSEFSIDRFVEYALDTPMIFVRRDGGYEGAVAGVRFEEYLSNGHSLDPIFQDWTDHLSTIFTDARLKQYIELRSVDGNKSDFALAATALWKGIMYDDAALEHALRLSPILTLNEWEELQRAVAVDGMNANVCGVNVGALAKDVVETAVAGLQNIAPEELHYLDPLRQLVCDENLCPADILLKNWNGSWHGSMDRVLEYTRVA